MFRPGSDEEGPRPGNVMEVLKGIPVSPGIVIGRIFVLEDEHQRIARRRVPAEAADAEVARLDESISASAAELAAVRDEARREMGGEAAKIFNFHLGMLADATLTEPMRAMIRQDNVAAEYAVSEVFREWAVRFEQMGDAAIRTKVSDFYDLSSRVLKHLIGEHQSLLAKLDHEAVIVAPDLTPSQTAGFDRSKVVAFATEYGGRTGHTSIVARALGIPAVVGCERLTEKATDGIGVIVDGDTGTVIIDPDERLIHQYEAYIEQRQTFRLSLADIAQLPSKTRDGTHISLLGNIEFPEEVKTVLENGGESVGLYRTEFLYLTRERVPTEEEHFEAYRECVELLGGRLLTLRTVDLGADKYTQARATVPERNPFLGLRSIRYCLKNISMFKTQLRAILRASALGPIQIMFPLVGSTSELRQARYLVRDVMDDLDEEKIPFDRKIPMGIMVEVPSAALMAHQFARECDFFSIGTNDLVQYTLAVDRTNERVASLYNPGHPAVTKLIKETVRAAKRHKIDVSCCGELAADLPYTVLLLGLGLRKLSVTASAIPELKRLIRSVTIGQCERIARKAASFDSDVAVDAFLRDRTRKIIPDAFGSRPAG